MPPSLYPGTRWRALDVFRGLTVLGMILVNASDVSGHAYPWLQHSQWDGFTLADSVFPGFLFIMGVAMGVSLHGYVRSGAPLRRIYPRIVRRSLVLFALGLLLNAAVADGLGDLRLMGVLQRLGLCYLLAAPILLQLSQRAQLCAAGAVLLMYWLVLELVPVPVPSAGDASIIANNLPAFIDRWLLGPAHLADWEPYTARIDPEGVLSTLPALVNVLLAAFAGRLLAAAPVTSATSRKLAALGGGGVLLALGFNRLIPINKALWTGSFVLLSSGLAALVLALCYEIVDVRGHAELAAPFETLGVNAIAAYLLSTALDAIVVHVQIDAGGIEQSLYDSWLQTTHLAAPHGAFLFAVVQAGLVWAFARWLRARGWNLKV
jgi:predicted acyltransferase